MKSPILGGSYVARSTNAADARMVNLYAEATAEGGKETGFLSRCPGLSLRNTVGSGPIRGMWAFGGFAYVVSGLELYKLTTGYAPTLLGSVTGTGPVSMSDNGTQLFIACNGPGFIYNAHTGVFSVINDPDFAGALNVGFIDGYFVFNQPNTQVFWVTTLYDGNSVDPLDFASAEGSPDNIVALVVDHREVWLFGTNSVEVWYDAGNTDFPLARIQGAYNEVGCAATFSVAKLDNGIFWLGSDARGSGVVYRSKGYTPVRVSTSAVEYAIQNYAVISDAVAYTYQQQGHNFYVLTFPTADATWVYDASTDLWHERAAWGPNGFMRHRSNCQMNFNGEIIVGDFETGKLYAFDLDNYTDNGAIQKWLRSWRAIPPGHNDLTRTAQHSLQLDMEVGAYNDLVDFVPDRPPGVMVLKYHVSEGATFASFNLNTGADPLRVVIDWGDGGTTTAVAAGTYSHEYGSIATTDMLVTLTGNCTQFVSNNASTAWLKEIVSWDSIMGLDYVSISDPSSSFPHFSTVPTNIPTTIRQISFAQCYAFNDTNIVSWDTSNLTSTSGMFTECLAFNQDIGGWNVSNVTDMSFMFNTAIAFNKNINAWNVSNVTNMNGVFYGASAFNQPLNSWDVSHVTDMSQMFTSAESFNQNINSWNTSAVISMFSTFYTALAFNQPLNSWDVSHVTDISQMFALAGSFNQNINGWNTSSVTTMDLVFASATAFNQPLNSWDVSNVTSMINMFAGANAFNQPLSLWSTHNVTNMDGVFYDTTVFNQDLSHWCVTNITSLPTDFDTFSALTVPHRPVWGTCPP